MRANGYTDKLLYKGWAFQFQLKKTDVFRVKQQSNQIVELLNTIELQRLVMVNTGDLQSQQHKDKLEYPHNLIGLRCAGNDLRLIVKWS